MRFAGMKVLWVTPVLLLLNCGNQPPVGFVNQTRHPDAALWTIWRAAQRSVAQEIDLNPVQQSTARTSPQILPGDPRALTVMPHQLTVTPEPDVSSAAFFVATGKHRADPTGMIPCPQPCNVRYATAYSAYRPELTNYAASRESSDSNFDAILQYEFENHILFSLGYDLRWR